MKQLFIITAFLLSITLNAQTFTNTKLEGVINLNLNTLSVKLKDYYFSGDLSEIMFKYKKYYLVKGQGKQLLISFDNLKSKRDTKISEIIILSGKYEKLVKAIKKNKLKESDIAYKYNYMFDASKNKELNTTWNNIEYVEAQKKLKEKYSSVTDLKNFEGKYSVKILRSGSIDYTKLEYNAELYITDAGFTFKSKIPSLMLIRGTHYIKEEFLPTEKGSFIIKDNYNNTISLRINSEKTSGAFTLIENGKTNTTSFIIENNSTSNTTYNNK